MATLTEYATPEALPSTQAGRVGRLLGLRGKTPISDVSLASKIAEGLCPSSVDALVAIIGRSSVIGPLIPEATLRRAKKEGKVLSREMSERLYEVSRVIDAVSRLYHGDQAAVSRFLTKPHSLLDGQSPLELAQSSSAGTDAVINMLQRAEYGFAV